MTDLMESSGANEETNFDSICDSTNTSQTLLKSQTSAQKNNSSCLPEQLPRDSYEKTLNGAQPTLFVHNSVPADSIVELTLPKGTVVNGPVSHSTSNKLCVSNKSSVSLSTAQPLGHLTKVSGALVSPLLHEHKITTKPAAHKASQQSLLVPVPNYDSVQAQNGAGLDFLCTQIATTESDINESSLQEESPKEMPIPKTLKTTEDIIGPAEHSAPSPEGSSDEFDIDQELDWDPQKEFMQFLLDNNDNNPAVEAPPQPTGERRRKRKMEITHLKDFSDSDYADMQHTTKKSKMENTLEYEQMQRNVSVNKLQAFDKSPVPEASHSHSDFPNETVEVIKQFIFNAPSNKCLDGNKDAKPDNCSFMGNKLTSKQIKSEPSSVFTAEQEPSFFPCTKCNVNFKEKAHLHRHMMYHLDGNNHFRHLNVPRPFICRECGRSFRDRNSLLKHMIIHQERREKLMEEIKGLKELQDEGRSARLQCPQCVFGTNCPKTFVQHAKTHEKDKRYYCCEECNFMAVTENELECHRISAHASTAKPTFVIIQKPPKKFQKKDAVKYDILASSKKPLAFSCKICSFTTATKNVLKKHLEFIHHQQVTENCFLSKMGYASPHFERQSFIKKTKNANSLGLQIKSEFYYEKHDFRKPVEMPSSSHGFTGLYRKNSKMQKARKTAVNLSLGEWNEGSTSGKPSSLLRSEKPKKWIFKRDERTEEASGFLFEDSEENYSDCEEKFGTLGYFKKVASKAGKSNNDHFSFFDSDQSLGESEDSEGRNLDVRGLSQDADTSVPGSRNVVDQYPDGLQKLTVVMLKKNDPRTKKDDEDQEEDSYDFSDYTSDATANFLECSENEQNPYARNYFIRRQRLPIKENRSLEKNSVTNSYDNSSHIQEDGDKMHFFKVKEECVEMEVCTETPESQLLPHSDSYSEFDLAPFAVERKSCPYCPAIFESGVGLSNHVRGHLHRVGLSYDARHVVSPEQVASQDKKPRIRRKINTIRRIKKVEKSESPTEHTCPLCGGWFDTKTGLSNHVRGHLKRIGKTKHSTSKSPVCILNEMLQNEEDYKHILKVLSKKRFLSRPFVSQKFATSDGLFLSPTGIPIKVQHTSQESKLWESSTPPPDEEFSDNQFSDSKLENESPQSASLLELLRKKKVGEETDTNKNRCQTARKRLAASPHKENSALNPQVKTTELYWQTDKNEPKKVCIHCNATFPSAVSLSNHLRAYARRKRAALLEGTTYECKQKKPRLRPGSKKKMFPLHHTPDETYRLTCRFCDLVFQGPLSVQEDWIKHLQRHIMNANVPRTGAGMVEVTSIPEVSSTQEQVPILVTQTAS
ncbi:zinc finger protein 644 isoform X2 [Erpetoichthys calabaricus]|nr:zinc finger protein 644 isoform X2 [Erpetoichthys calabaricus]XP_028667260.1 zinc finger protein 644 isoform X2 [Erpetoichthys calabaricus]